MGQRLEKLRGEYHFNLSMACLCGAAALVHLEGMLLLFFFDAMVALPALILSGGFFAGISIALAVTGLLEAKGMRVAMVTAALEDK